VTGLEVRKSSSSPMLWPLVYGHRRDELASKSPALLEELDLVTNLTTRVAKLFTIAGMAVSPQQMEPLQLVKYASSERFGPHHDYHEVDEHGKLGSSVQGEQRAFTVLFFGASLGPSDGGGTHFPHLGLTISPQLGDAVAWANVDAEGEPNPRSLHEGLPPAEGHRKVVVNCWIADRPFDLQGSLEKAVVT